MNAKEQELVRGETDDLLKLTEGLDDYEIDFLQRMDHLLEHSGASEITMKMVKFLHGMWDRHCRSR